MYKKIDHMVIVVKDVRQAAKDYERLLGIPPNYQPREEEGQGYIQCGFTIGDTMVILAQPVSSQYQAGVAMKRTLERDGEGLHNLSFAVGSVDREMERLKREGEKVIPSAHSHSFFFHPKKMHGVLVQIME